MILDCRSFSVHHVAIGLPYRLLCCFARLTLALKRRELEQLLKALCATPAALHSQLEDYAAQPFNQSISYCNN